eukprot:gene19085-24912_t
MSLISVNKRVSDHSNSFNLPYYRGLAGRRKIPTGKGLKAVVPPPLINEQDVWTEVKHESGQTYWWNTVTNETTSLGSPKPQAVVPVNSAMPPAPAPIQSGGIMSGLGGVVAEGFAFGIGSSLARHAVGSILGSGSSSSSQSLVDNNTSSNSNDSDWGDGSGGDGEGWDI